MVSRATKSVRSWFSPEQACQYLAQQLNTEVILNDLEELIDNQQIQLYVRLNKYKSICINNVGELIYFKTFYIRKDKVVSPDYLTNKQIDFEDLPDNVPLQITYEIEKGVYATNRRSAQTERFNFENSYYSVFDCNPNRSGLVAILNEKITDLSLQKSNLREYPNYLNNNLDVTCVEFMLNPKTDQFEFGFPLEELEKLVDQSCNDYLNTKTKHSLYAIIYALTLKDLEEPDVLKGAVKHNIEAKKNNTASLIITRLQNKGLDIDPKTVREHIKNAYDHYSNKVKK